MKNVDAILILGHRLEKDGSPSEDQIRRIDRAAAYWKENNASIVMPCGGLTPGQKQTEAEVMRTMLIARGVPEQVIRLEDRSRITIENVRNARALLGEGKKVALVTSDYHLERALDDCRRAGLIAYGVAAETPAGEYREQMFAEEKRIAERMQARRESGMTEQEIIDAIVERTVSQERQQGESHE